MLSADSLPCQLSWQLQLYTLQLATLHFDDEIKRNVGDLADVCPFVAEAVTIDNITMSTNIASPLIICLAMGFSFLLLA